MKKIFVVLSCMLHVRLLVSVILLASAIESRAGETPQVTVPSIAGQGSFGPQTAPKTTGKLGVAPLSEPAPATSADSGLTVGLNFTASTLGVDSGYIPPDTMGAVGPNHIVELINGRYSVYRKSDGALVQTSSLDQFWINAGAIFFSFSFTYDPRVLYDPFSQRWFASSADSLSFPMGNNDFLIAVSKSSDPTAGWTGFAIDSDPSHLRWADFPTLGFNRDGVYLAADLYSVPSHPEVFYETTTLVIPKSDLLASPPTVAHVSRFQHPPDFSGYKVQPVVDFDNMGLPEALFSGANYFSLVFSQIVGNIISPEFSGPVIFPITPYYDDALFRGAHQPGSKPDIEIYHDALMGYVVRQNGSFWGATVVAYQGRQALRWFQIDANTNALIQEGLIADPALDLYYPSIAVNKFGDIVIGFNGSSETQFVSGYAVAGHTVSGVTTFGTPVLLKAGVAGYDRHGLGDQRNRWGDYSTTVVDPDDPLTFWTFQEFVSSEDIWSTQITQLLLPPPEIVVALDIKPGSAENTVNPKSKGATPVAILGTNSFDASTVDTGSVRFGPNQALAHGRGQLEDVNGDGQLDLVLHFRTQDSGIQCGDTTVSITGETVNGIPIQGSDIIRTVGCNASVGTKK